MQATTIPIAEIPPNTLPVAAVLASKGLPQSAPAFASVIHEILQSSVAADDEAPPQALAKNGKSTKSAATPAASTAVAGTSPLRLLRGSPMLAPAFLKQAVAPLPPATPVRASANGPVLATVLVLAGSASTSLANFSTVAEAARLRYAAPTTKVAMAVTAVALQKSPALADDTTSLLCATSAAGLSAHATAFLANALPTKSLATAARSATALAIDALPSVTYTTATNSPPTPSEPSALTAATNLPLPGKALTSRDLTILASAIPVLSHVTAGSASAITAPRPAATLLASHPPFRDSGSVLSVTPSITSDIAALGPARADASVAEQKDLSSEPSRAAAVTDSEPVDVTTSGSAPAEEVSSSLEPDTDTQILALSAPSTQAAKLDGHNADGAQTSPSLPMLRNLGERTVPTFQGSLQPASRPPARAGEELAQPPHGLNDVAKTDLDSKLTATKAADLAMVQNDSQLSEAGTPAPLFIEQGSPGSSPNGALKANLPTGHPQSSQSSETAPPPVSDNSGSSRDSASQQETQGDSSRMDRARAAQKNSTVTSLGIAPGSTSQPVLAPTPTNSPLTTGPPVGGPVSAVASDTVQPSATVPNITASHDPPAPESSNAPLPAPTLDPPGVAHTVTDAQMAQSGGHSEMRIAMQSDNLGNIELRASVSGNSIGANITVEKRDAHTALAMELPALQQALSDKQLRVEQISLLHGSLPAAGGDTAAQHSPGQNQGGQRPPQNFPSAPPSAGASGFYAATGFSADVGEIFDAQGRLSVLA